MAQINKPYIAFSGGKDSHVVLDLVRSIDPSVAALVGYDDWVYPETDELLNRTTDIVRIAATVWHASIFTSWRKGKPLQLPDGVTWFESANNSRVAPYAKEHGFDACFLGLRKDEAVYRRMHLSCHGAIHNCKKHGVLECNPISDWSVEDVWSYLLSRNVKYNRVYDKLTAMEVPLKQQRVGPLAVDSVLGYGQLTQLKRGWPDFFNRLAAEFPELRAYA